MFNANLSKHDPEDFNNSFIIKQLLTFISIDLYP